MSSTWSFGVKSNLRGSPTRRTSTLSSSPLPIGHLGPREARHAQHQVLVALLHLAEPGLELLDLACGPAWPLRRASGRSSLLALGMRAESSFLRARFCSSSVVASRRSRSAASSSSRSSVEALVLDGGADLVRVLADELDVEHGVAAKYSAPGTAIRRYAERAAGRLRGHLGAHPVGAAMPRSRTSRRLPISARIAPSSASIFSMPDLVLQVHAEVDVGGRAVLRRLAVLAHHDERPLERDEDREHEVVEDVRERVEARHAARRRPSCRGRRARRPRARWRWSSSVVSPRSIRMNAQLPLSSATLSARRWLHERFSSNSLLASVGRALA